jgi:hypothetical protein
MAMTRTTTALCAALLLAVCGCSAVTPRPSKAVDCSFTNAYQFLNIDNFASGSSNWFLYADSTPGGVPDVADGGSNVPLTEIPPPGHCVTLDDTPGDNSMIELIAYGHNFYGSGFGDYQPNLSSSRAIGTGYQGISFWARSEGNTDKTFMLYVDDGHTIILPQTVPDGGVAPYGPGDQIPGTECLLPPDQSLGIPACYNTTGTAAAFSPRLPDPKECGNQFHTYVTTTTDWQLFLIPWSELVQWSCPNKEVGGIDMGDIAQIEIKFLQGTNYDVWVDNFSFYRPRTDGGP